MQSTTGRSPKPTYKFVPKTLKIYGGAGEAPRWELSYSCISATREESELQRPTMLRPGRTMRGEVPRELPRDKEQSESAKIYNERWDIHNEHEPVGVTDLFCEETLERGYRNGQEGPDNGSNKPNRERISEGLRDPSDLGDELPEDIKTAVQKVLHDMGAVQVTTGMDTTDDSDFVGRLWNWEDEPSETSNTGTPTCFPYGHAQGLQREFEGDNLRRHELSTSTQGSTDSHRRLLRRETDSLPSYYRNDSCWNPQNNDNKPFPK